MELPLLLKKNNTKVILANYMSKALIIYLVIELGILILAFLSYVFWDKRYRKNHGTQIPSGFEETKEVTVDPKTGKRLKVYFNPTTGARFYYEEANPKNP